jgi:pilus assembly protein FimV
MDAVDFGLRTELVAESNGRVNILIRSRGPVREPFLSFRIVLSASDVRLLRDYTVLLDPPGMGPVVQQRLPLEPALRVSDLQPSAVQQPVGVEVKTALPEPIELPIDTG